MGKKTPEKITDEELEEFIQQKIEKIAEIAGKTDIGFRALPYEYMNKQNLLWILDTVDIDQRIKKFEHLVSLGRYPSKSHIKSEIELLLSFLYYAVEINHHPAADKALEANNLLTAENRLQLMPAIIDIEKFRKRIEREAGDNGAQEICSKCEGACCGRDIEQSFSEMDFFYMFFTVSKTKRDEIWRILNQPDTVGINCRFKGDNGCKIPANATPYFCKTYYCEDVPVIHEFTDSYEKQLKVRMKKLQKELKKIGFDLELDD